eukprot:TRINITY_DN6204_c2_g1_i1.p1 TRINITY_DN6204_c2_g1~~TRINITY_DN6204_c2_g1_i1.p1  ORF type:complete len:307 (+),score=72.37 TRINITY_DN6204_c2_g1_i1:8-928(+)
MPAPSSNSKNFPTDVFLGGISAAFSTTLFAPLERMKIVLQSQGEMVKTGRLNSRYNGVVDCGRRLYNNEGFIALFRGNLAKVMGYFPGQFLNFALKDTFKLMFQVDPRSGYFNKFASNIASGAAADGTSLLLLYPINYTRTRLANDVIERGGSGQRQFNGHIDAVRKTLASDGVRGLFRGLPVSIAGIMIYRGFYFGLYDSVKTFLIPRDGKINPALLLTLGYTVTLSAGLLSYPFDTISKRLMQTSMANYKYSSSFDALKTVARTEGVVALWRGASITIIRSLGGAAALALYDMFSIYKQASRRV